MIGALTLSVGSPRTHRPGALLIAAGTEYETLVRDARDIRGWGGPASELYKGSARRVVYHHTASGLPTGRSTHRELEFLLRLYQESPYGLPYNFVVMPGGSHRIYYLNDVDRSWPHTYGGNWATAIAAVGNYSVHQPRPAMVGRMLRLADALATMWGRWVEETQHRDHYATECPGRHLSPLLPALDRQRA